MRLMMTFIVNNALHVSGVNAHHQELMNCICSLWYRWVDLCGYGSRFSNKILGDTKLLASAYPRYNGLTVAFDVFTVNIIVKFDYCRCQSCFCDLHLFVVCFNRSVCFPRECQTSFSLCSVCYGSTWSVTVWSVQDIDFLCVSRIEDTAGRVLGLLKVSIATNGHFPLVFLHAFPYRIRTGVQTITPLIYRLLVFLQALDATRSVRYLSPLQPGTSWSGRNEW